MRHGILVILLVVAMVGCAPRKATKPPKRIVPSENHRQLLWLEGIQDPYTKKGQRRLQQLVQQQKEIDKLQEDRLEAIRKRRKRR